MKALEELFSSSQYNLNNGKKISLLSEELIDLTGLHYKHCTVYKRILDNLGYKVPANTEVLSELPFLPIELFKTADIKSIPANKVLKILTSSGTTGRPVSRIAIDAETSLLQVKALASIITSYIGSRRLPMIIIDTEKTIRNKSSLSARGAGLVGLSNFGRDHFFALDENMNLKIKELKEYVRKHKNERILIFGFTFMVWEYLLNSVKNTGREIDLGLGILIHGGGWKKLAERSVTDKVFKSELSRAFGLKNIYNFYGMVEQVGSIYMECEHGYLHTPNFAEVLIRDYNDWSVLPYGRAGIIQTLSVLPRSYPGHSLLTDDIGVVAGADNCKCGRKGTYFTVTGRVPKAELRGCSDTYAENVMNAEKRAAV